MYNPTANGTYKYSGLCLGGAAHWLAHTLVENYERRSIWLIAPSEDEARQFVTTLKYWLAVLKNPIQVALFPEDDPRTFDGASPSPSTTINRAGILNSLYTEHPIVVVSTVLGALTKSINPKDFGRASITLNVGDEYVLPSLLRSISNIGYQNADFVNDEGLYSHKGDAIRLWPISGSAPIQLSFFDNELDGISSLDPKTHQAQSNHKSIVISPARELPLRPSAIKNAEAHTLLQVTEHNLSESNRNRAIRDFKQGIWFPGAEDYISACYKLSWLLDQCSDVILYQPQQCNKQFRSWCDRLPSRWEHLDRHDHPPIDPSLRYASSKEVDHKMQTMHQMGDLVEDGVQLDTQENQPYEISRHSLADWCQFFKGWLDGGYTVAIISPNHHNLDRLGEIFSAHNIPHQLSESFYPVPDNAVSLLVGQIGGGFNSKAHKQVILTTEEIFGRESKKHRRTRQTLHSASRQKFNALTLGDYVVHQDHGIGQYQGVEKVKALGEYHDYIKLSYFGDELLLLPASYLEKIQIYRSAGGSPLKLDKIGSKSWAKRKAKIKEKALAMAHELLRKQAQRQQRKGHTYPESSLLLSQVSSDFPFELTPDQSNAIEDISDSLASDKATDSLLVGDVGFGKTEVAIRAIATVVSEGHQVLFLCPTTVLSLQHHRTLEKRFRPYNIHTGVLSRLQSTRAARQTKADFASGKVNILIGTQALLSRDLSAKHIGLVIVDEEHRFGVKQKEKIRNFAQRQSNSPSEYLAMSATPIPRTLHMALSGLRDVSVIASPPDGRRPIHTLTLRRSKTRIKQQVQRELERGGQVFFIHNRIKTLAKTTDMIQALLPHALIRPAHGRMDKKTLEKTLIDFMDRKFHVLVCTSIVENGIDLPNANTIIIDNAHMMGMSQLYQLRGRVGRSEQQGYCSFLVPKELSKEATHRIGTLQRYTELGSGFSIAAADLELRGSGNLLGKEQSGHIQSVGLDTYLEILSQVVDELKSKTSMPFDADISLPIKGSIPEDYIPDSAFRLQIYQALAVAGSISETRGLLDSWERDYGPVPTELRNLTWHTEARIWCQLLGIRKLYWLNKHVHLQVDTRLALSQKRVRDVCYRYQARFDLEINGHLADIRARFEKEEAKHPFHYLLWLFQSLKPKGQ